MVCYKFLRRFFHFGLKNKYKFLIIGFVFAFVLFMGLSSFGYCSSDSAVSLTGVIDETKSISNNIIIERETGSVNRLLYFYVPSSGDITLTSNVSVSRIYYSADDVSLGTSLERLGQLPAGGTVTFRLNHSGYVLLTAQSSNVNIDCQFIADTGLSAASYSLCDILKPDNIWGIFENSIPFVLVVVVFGFGWLIIHNAIKKSSKGKARI